MSAEDLSIGPEQVGGQNGAPDNGEEIVDLVENLTKEAVEAQAEGSKELTEFQKQNLEIREALLNNNPNAFTNMSSEDVGEFSILKSASGTNGGLLLEDDVKIISKDGVSTLKIPHPGYREAIRNGNYDFKAALIRTDGRRQMDVRLDGLVGEGRFVIVDVIQQDFSNMNEKELGDLNTRIKRVQEQHRDDNPAPKKTEDILSVLQ